MRLKNTNRKVYYNLHTLKGIYEYQFVDDSALGKNLTYQDMFAIQRKYVLFNTLLTVSFVLGVLSIILPFVLAFSVRNSESAISVVFWSFALCMVINLVCILFREFNERYQDKFSKFEDEWQDNFFCYLPNTNTKLGRENWKLFYAQWKLQQPKRKVEPKIIIHIKDEEEVKENEPQILENLYENIAPSLQGNIQSTIDLVSSTLKDIKNNANYLEEQFLLERTLDEYLPTTLKLYTTLSEKQRNINSVHTKKLLQSLKNVDERVKLIRSCIDEEKSKSFNVHINFVEQVFASEK